MTETVQVDMAVVGGGSGGLSVAAGAAQMGASVLLFEKGRMGGDCLNYGCVPSKATIAAAHAASAFRNAGRFGIAPETPKVDAAALRRHVQGVIAGIAPHDSVERFEGLGVRVVEAPARFVSRRLLEGGGVRVEARWIVLATGSDAGGPAHPRPRPNCPSSPTRRFSTWRKRRRICWCWAADRSALSSPRRTGGSARK